MCIKTQRKALPALGWLRDSENSNWSPEFKPSHVFFLISPLTFLSKPHKPFGISVFIYETGWAIDFANCSFKI